MIYLAFVVVPKIKQAPLEEYVKVSAVSIIIPRFSTITVMILGIIVITGPFLLYILENNLSLTLASFYGKALITKLVLAAIMISIGGYNQIVIHRQAVKVASVAMSTSSSTSRTRTVNSDSRISPMKRRQVTRQHRQNNNHNNELLSSSSSSSSNSYIPYNSHRSAVSKLNASIKVEAGVGILLLAACCCIG